jgi:hypothetical protein
MNKGNPMKPQTSVSRPSQILALLARFGVLAIWVWMAACTSAPPAPEGEEGETTPALQSTGDNQTIYLPLFQKNGDPFPLPTDAPLAEWTVAGGVIPIMPGAQAGAEMDGSYVFTTFVPLPNIEMYYTQELQARGWQPLSIAESTNLKEMLFEMGAARVTIKMDFLPEQNLSYVVIEG